VNSQSCGRPFRDAWLAVAHGVARSGMPSVLLARSSRSTWKGRLAAAGWENPGVIAGKEVVLAMESKDLSPVERALVEAIIAGHELACGGLDPARLAVTEDHRYLVRAEVIRDLLLGRYLEQSHPQGLRLARARIIGALDLDRLAPIIGLGLSQCVVDQPVTMRGARLPWLMLFSTHLPGIAANGVYVEGAVELVQTRIDADSDSGAIQIAGAYIGGVFDCNGSTFVNNSGPAFVADDLKVNGSLELNRTRMTSDCESAAAQLTGALISGSLRGDLAVLVNKSGPALAADNLKVNGSMLLRHSRCLGNHILHSAVRLHGAHIGDNLEFDGTELSNDSGAALTANELQVDGATLFRNEFHAAGRGRPTLDLTAARIGGGLDFGNGRILSPDGLALDLASASVTGLCLPGDAICRSGLREDPQSWEDDGHLRLDSFTYSALDPRGADLDRWLLWLHSYTPAYATQPYQQLAAIHRASGNEAAARRVLIAQQDDLLARGELGGRWARAWHRLKGIAVGYGYQSWRALVGLVVVVLLAIVLGLAAGHIRAGTGHFEAAHTTATGRPGTACSIVEQVGLGLDLGLPAINTGLNNQCALDSTSVGGQILTGAAWLLQALGWALATLVVAGYTGLIRKI